MAAYVVSARIDRGRPHLVAPPRAIDARSWSSRLGARDASVVETQPRDEDGLALWWEAVHDRWSQLTFFLFDAESWR
ncbi:MAG: hypothetical protein ACJ765_06085 [Chloroflexota bacterium]